MQPHQQEIFYYPGEYEEVQVIRNGTAYDVIYCLRDEQGDVQHIEQVLTAADWETVTEVLWEDYDIEV